MSLKTFFVCTSMLVTYVSGLPYNNESGPGYGDEWLWFHDEYGETHVMNFSKLPQETRTMILGDAYFYLFTRHSLEGEELLIPPNDENITSQYFNASNEIKVITHGWLSSQNSTWLINMRDTFLRTHDYNVIVVDWSELAKNPVYPWPALSTRYVGKKTAQMLNALAKTYQIDGKGIHLIGHSLGSHVMGYTGDFSQNRIHRITGLDPARPLFELPLMPSKYRLEESDAEYVDIIHTCGGVLGYKKSHGHADFYPNNGKPKQPGCEGTQQVIEACSHGRSTLFFDESILSRTGFVAYPCESWAKFDSGECRDSPTHMGYLSTSETRGDHYLYTNAEPEYARGQEQGNQTNP